MNIKYLLSTVVLGLLSLCLTAQNCYPPPTATDNILYLNTQTEVDNFGPCSYFYGSIYVQGGDVENLHSFAGLQEISGELYIANTSLTNLQGLYNLKTLGSNPLIDMAGNFSLHQNYDLTDITAMANLQNINNGGIFISQNEALATVDAFSSLHTIQNGIFISSNANLENLDGFSNLTNVGGTISVTNNPSLSYCCGIYNAIVQSNPDLELFGNLSGCNSAAEIAAACTYTSCNNVTHPGIIGYNQSVCYPGDIPDLLVNVQSPSGGTGALEYMWIFTTQDPTAGPAVWTPIPNSNTPDYQPGPIFETTWFARCVRREGCTGWTMESNSVRICLDEEYPVVTYEPPNDTIQCWETPYFGYPEFTDDCDEYLDIHYQIDSIPHGCLYKWVKTWYATDDCDRTTMATQTIYVIDDEAPYFTYFPADTTIDCYLNPYDYFGTPLAKDHCDPYPYLSYEVDSVVTTCIKTYTKTWTATDFCDNYITKTQTVTTIDTIAPHIYLNAPYDWYYSGDTITAECDNTPPFNPNSVTVYDQCDPYPSVDFYEEAYPGDCLVDGYKRLMKCWWVATDECNNTTTFTIYVKIVDTTKPTFSYVPPNFEMDCPGNPVFGIPQYYDNCPGDLTLTHYVDTIVNQLNCYHKYICTWRVTDMCGNWREATQIITAEDDEAPVFEQLFPITGTDCYNPLVITPPVVSDNCDTYVDVSYTIDTIPENYFVRYKIYWYAEDNCHNVADTFQIVSVPCGTVFSITNFSTNVENEAEVALEWSVMNERSHGIYILERSKDGEDFEILANEIEAISGVQGEAVTYLFVDEEPMRGYNYYQIRYFDTDGTAEKSTVEQVAVLAEVAKKIMLYPNPAKDNLTVEFLQPTEEPRQVSIYNTTGQLIQQQSVLATETVLSLDLTNLQPAIYWVLIQNENGKTVSKRIVVQE